MCGGRAGGGTTTGVLSVGSLGRDLVERSTKRRRLGRRTVCLKGEIFLCPVSKVLIG